MELFRLSITACITPLFDQLFSEFEDALVVIWPVYEVFEVPAASCGRQLIVYLERNRDEQGQHAIRTRRILREIAMTPTSGVLLDFAQLAVALPTIIWAETIPSCPLPFIESENS